VERLAVETILVALRRLVRKPGTVANFSGDRHRAHGRAGDRGPGSVPDLPRPDQREPRVLNLLPIPVLDGGNPDPGARAAVRRDFSTRSRSA